MDKIEITKDQFREAIAAEAASIMTNSKHNGSPEAVTLLIMGGSAYATSVMHRLFGEKVEKDD